MGVRPKYFNRLNHTKNGFAVLEAGSIGVHHQLSDTHISQVSDIRIAVLMFFYPPINSMYEQLV